MKEKYQTIFTRQHYSTILKHLFGDFGRHSIKTWRSWANVFNFDTMSILAIRCNRRQKTVSTPKYVLNNKTGPLFLEFNWCEKKLFEKIANSVTYKAPLIVDLKWSTDFVFLSFFPRVQMANR